jgi:beta-xylosidase
MRVLQYGMGEKLTNSNQFTFSSMGKYLKYRGLVLLLLSTIFFAGFSQNKVGISGDFGKIYDQSIGEKGKWYINDHCFIKATDGKWHMFGITHEEPANPREEKKFAHAIADSLTQAVWIKQSFALTIAAEAPWTEHHLWAPHVVFDQGIYYMYYCAGGEKSTEYKIHLATSKNLFQWTRHPENPMIIDGYDARDPFILRLNDEWVMYYTATRPADGGNHVVMSVISNDLIHWTNKQVAFTHAKTGTYGGPTESPFVVFNNGKYYLFVCTNQPYDNTAVYESDTPYHWNIENRVGDIPAHCAEVMQDSDKDWYISRAGWGRGGLYLAKLTWKE